MYLCLIGRYETLKCALSYRDKMRRDLQVKGTLGRLYLSVKMWKSLKNLNDQQPFWDYPNLIKHEFIILKNDFLSLFQEGETERWFIFAVCNRSLHSKETFFNLDRLPLASVFFLLSLSLSLSLNASFSFNIFLVPDSTSEREIQDPKLGLSKLMMQAKRRRKLHFHITAHYR